LIAWGEGWHNNHHAFQRSARHGLEWWEFDANWIVIRALAAVGLAKDIQLVPRDSERYRLGQARKVLTPAEETAALLRRRLRASVPGPEASGLPRQA
jgi:hypothetical protein